MGQKRKLANRLKMSAGKAPRSNGGVDGITTGIIESPIGELLVAATANAVCMIEFPCRGSLSVRAAELGRRFGCAVGPGENGCLEQLEFELRQYFAGKLRRFAVPIVHSGTPFQVTVWKRLFKIPYGKTVSYEQVAVDVGKPAASRAVGTANGRNRISIVIPCHRVLNKGGGLGGYGGELWRKQFLLDLEQRAAGAASH
jgi:AraC family transcriptional regulator, regulatory protein of adaptative response / methylated-DNA-[protein]-cysteine methyltransferase